MSDMVFISGDVAQLGERRLRTAEVVGSSPIVSTMVEKGLRLAATPFFNRLLKKSLSDGTFKNAKCKARKKFKLLV